MADGINVPYFCEEGVCGSCETAVLAGEPDHRDLILAAAAGRAAGRTMMVCRSGSKSLKLTLDI